MWTKLTEDFYHPAAYISLEMRLSVMPTPKSQIDFTMYFTKKKMRRKFETGILKHVQQLNARAVTTNGASLNFVGGGSPTLVN